MARTTPLWVFGYGSLMWDPGFEHLSCRIADLAGYRRGFSMWSLHYRGTPGAPGLVLALEPAPGASCRGVAFEVAEDATDTTIAYLRARELISYAYREVTVPVMLEDGRRVRALAFVVDREHPQYSGALSPGEQAAIIARAGGQRGTNAEYLANTARQLRELGIDDPEIFALERQVAGLCRDLKQEAGHGRADGPV